MARQQTGIRVLRSAEKQIGITIINLQEGTTT
jgi:hypothetical protein